MLDSGVVDAAFAVDAFQVMSAGEAKKRTIGRMACLCARSTILDGRLYERSAGDW